MGSNAEENAKIFDEVSESSGTMEEAFKSSSKTLDFKWNKALSQAKVMAISLFDALKARLIPKIEMLTAVIAKVTNRFTSLSPEMQNTIINFAAMAAAIGPAAIILGTIITKIGAAFTFVSGVVTTASTIISTLMTPAISALIAPIAAVIAIIAGLVASFIYLYNTNEDFRDKVTAVWETLQSVATVIFNEIKKTVEFVFKAIQAFWEKHGAKIMAIAEFIWNTILDIIDGALKIIKDTIKFICSIIRGDWKGAWDAVKGIIGSAFEIIVNLLGNLKDSMLEVFTHIKDKVIEKVKAIVKGIKDKFEDMLEAGKKLVGKIISGIGKKLSDLWDVGKKIAKKIVDAVLSIDFIGVGKSICQGIIDGMLGAANAVGEGAGYIAGKIGDLLPHSPAKKGPLKDIDKLDFYNPIRKSIMTAKYKLDMPALKLVDGLIGDIPKDLNFGISNLNGNNGSNKNITLSGPFNFYGVQDTYQLMKELQSTIKRYGG
jgi:phage-related protein